MKMSAPETKENIVNTTKKVNDPAETEIAKQVSALEASSHLKAPTAAAGEFSAPLKDGWSLRISHPQADPALTEKPIEPEPSLSPYQTAAEYDARLAKWKDQCKEFPTQQTQAEPAVITTEAGTKKYDHTDTPRPAPANISSPRAGHRILPDYDSDDEIVQNATTDKDQPQQRRRIRGRMANSQSVQWPSRASSVPAGIESSPETAPNLSLIHI